MANSNGRVCLLSDGEATAFKNLGEKPDCKLHDHVTPQEAFDMTAPPFTRKMGEQEKPCAVWVGPRQITLTEAYEWRIVRKMRVPLAAGGVAVLLMTTKQLVSCSA